MKIKLSIVFTIAIGTILDIVFKSNIIKLAILLLDTLFVSWYQKKYSVKIYNHTHKTFNYLVLCLTIIMIILLIHAVFIIL